MPPNPEIHAELRLHQDVQTLDDEWSGITDPVVRRKLQNRLNQRAARRRKAGKQEQTKPPKFVGSADSRESLDSRAVPMLRNGFKLSDLARLRSFSLLSSEWSVAQEHFNKSNKSAFVSIRSKASCQRWYEVMLEGRLVEIKDMAARIQQERDSAWAYPLPADHLISLVYYNVYRALIQNVELLGLDLNLMYTDDYPSPFTPCSQTATSAIRRLPLSLEPTELQKTMAHHPQWDIVPDPVVRDNILRYGEENINDVELCLDMVGGGIYSDTGGNTQEQTGLIIWGEPWDLEGWEVTESFARKWGWMLRNAPIINSTNRWRRARGEDALDFDTILWLEQVESTPGVRLGV